MMNTERKRSISSLEMDSLSPIEKFQKYGKFPVEMVAHIFLVIFCTCQIVLIIGQRNNISRSQEHLIYNMFIDESDKRSVDYSKTLYLYTPSEIRNHVNNSINNYFNIKDKSLELVEFPSTELFSILEFSYINPNKVNNLYQENYQIMENANGEMSRSIDNDQNILKSFLYKVTNKYLGPFQYDDRRLKLFLNDVIEFKMNYTYKTYIPMYYNDYYSCNLWTINQIYNFASRGHLDVKLNIDRLGCEDINLMHSYINLFINKLLWIHLIIICLAIYSLIKTWTVINKVFESYIKIKTKHEDETEKKNKDSFDKNEKKNQIVSDRSLSDDSYDKKINTSHYYNPLLSDESNSKDNFNKSPEEQENEEKFEYKPLEENQISKRVASENKEVNLNLVEKKEEKENRIMTIMSWWQIFCLTGNIIQIFASGISLFDNKLLFRNTEILVGFGAMLAFINMGRYIEYDGNYSIFYVIIQNSLPKVTRYLLGVTPVFLGFIFFGLCIFWRSERFTSFSDVMIILFALAQGDSVFSAFKDLSGFYFFIGQVYLYSFCILFIVVVLNIFIAIIEEAYILSRMEKKTHWVFDYIMDQEKEKEGKESNEENNQKNQNESLNKFSKTKEKLTFIPKVPVIEPTSYKSTTMAKSFNNKHRTKFEEDNSLSYQKNFNLNSNKPESTRNVREIEKYNYNSINSFSMSNLNKLNEQQNQNIDKENYFKINEIDKNNISPDKGKKKSSPHLVQNKQSDLPQSSQNLLFEASTGKSANLKITGNKKKVNFSNLIIDDNPQGKSPINTDVQNKGTLNFGENSQKEIGKSAIKTILKKDENKSQKNGSLNNLDDKDGIKREIGIEFQKIFNDLDDLENYSKYSLENSPAYLIDDLRLLILDFTSGIENKKNEIEISLKNSKF